MKKFFFFLSLSVFLYQISASQNVGIWTTTPQASFNVAADKTVLFGFDTTSAGNKFIWYPTKSALRFGAIDPSLDLTAWNYANVGVRSLAFGLNTRATAPQSIASGVSTTASGFYAWAHGFATYAYGDHSMAIGQNTGAEGNNSFALGNGARAYGDYSQAIGNNNTASGVFSTALGTNTYAKAYNCFVIGRYNDSVATSSNTGWVSTDPLFIIGNGGTPSLRSNAVTVLKNGNMGVNINNPVFDLEVGHFTNAFFSTNNGFAIRNKGSNNHYWTFYTADSDGDLELRADGIFRGSFAAGTGIYTPVSDIRFKNNIQLMNSVLSSVLQLRPSTYYLNNTKANKRSLGFIAQEVEPIFPELINMTGENQDIYTLDYTGFSVLAIKAIQEQQEIITTQQKRIDDLEKRLQMIESKLK